MIGILANALMQAASQNGLGGTESLAAINIFREACTLGEINLRKSGGRIVSEKDVPKHTAVSYTALISKRTFIEFAKPRSTYLILTEFKHVQPRGIANTCAVVSYIISRSDAAQALVETTPDVKPKQTWIPAMYLPEWTVDLPKRGFRKSLWFRDNGWMVLEVAMYKPS
jgi:hypothetical protein